MVISTKDWTAYIKKMASISQSAADQMQNYIQKNGFGDTDAIIEYAYALVSKYGEASAELACMMYDAIAEMQSVIVPAAVPVDPVGRNYIKAMITGLVENESVISGAVGRCTKQAGQETMLSNARRDGAYFAWVASGSETCAYCIALSSIGWQKAGKKTLNNTGKSHVHANCDCNYVVDLKGDLKVEGYDPHKWDSLIESSTGIDMEYLENFEGALISTVDNRNTVKDDFTSINQLRRALYQQNRTKITSQHRAAYAKRTEQDDNG